MNNLQIQNVIENAAKWADYADNITEEGFSAHHFIEFSRSLRDCVEVINHLLQDAQDLSELTETVQQNTEFTTLEKNYTYTTASQLISSLEHFLTKDEKVIYQSTDIVAKLCDDNQELQCFLGNSFKYFPEAVQKCMLSSLSDEAIDITDSTLLGVIGLLLMSQNEGIAQTAVLNLISSSNPVGAELIKASKDVAPHARLINGIVEMMTIFDYWEKPIHKDVGVSRAVKSARVYRCDRCVPYTKKMSDKMDELLADVIIDKD